MTSGAIQVLGTAATLYGLGGALSVLLQARQMHVCGSSGDVSARFFGVYVGGFAIWLLYGLGIGSVPIVVAHAVGLLCGAVTLTVVFRLREPVESVGWQGTGGRGPSFREGGVDGHTERKGDDERLYRNTTRAKEVKEMRESCYCGRTGEIEDREPVATKDGARELRCPGCGHLDSMDWLPEEARRHVFEEAERRQPTAA